MAQLSDCGLIILAAGKGTRMQSALPKVMHKIAGLSMLGHVIQNGQTAGFNYIILVTSPEQDAVRAEAETILPSIKHAIQQDQLGTGDAVRAGFSEIEEMSRAVVVFGDTPLLRPEIMADLGKSESDLIVLGFTPHNPGRYGRIITEDGRPKEIIEFKDANEEQLGIRLCNGGAMGFSTALLNALLPQLSSENAQNEYYLTDLVKLAHNKKYKTALIEGSKDDVIGIDTRESLAHGEQIIQERYRGNHLRNGITMEDPSSVYFHYDTEIANDVYLEPHIRFGPNVKIENNARIKAFSHIEGTQIGEGAQIGPFARLRPKTIVGAHSKIGNFVEAKNAQLAAGVKISHLSYIGDAIIGAEANIGAGTITCNYDGFNKHITEIGAAAFIGSNTSLIAPVKIGEGAYIGSSSAISGDIEPDALGVTRAPLRIIKGWAKKFRHRNSGSK